MNENTESEIASKISHHQSEAARLRGRALMVRADTRRRVAMARRKAAAQPRGRGR
jgi:hypothetical protein